MHILRLQLSLCHFTNTFINTLFLLTDLSMNTRNKPCNRLDMHWPVVKQWGRRGQTGSRIHFSFAVQINNTMSSQDGDLLIWFLLSISSNGLTTVQCKSLDQFIITWRVSGSYNHDLLWPGQIINPVYQQLLILHPWMTQDDWGVPLFPEGWRVVAVWAEVVYLTKLLTWDDMGACLTPQERVQAFS